MTLCNTFKRLALDTWDSIQKSRQLNFQLKEETFTDINMLTLKAKHSRQVRTKVFNKVQKGRNRLNQTTTHQNRREIYLYTKQTIN